MRKERVRLRRSIIKILRNAPYFRGRDRLLSSISATYRPKPLTINHGLQMILDPYEWLQQGIIAKGCTEPLTTKLIQRLLTPGDTFVDVGAHIGHHALIGAREVGAAGRVIAIDPQPYNADRIGQNALINDMSQIEIVPIAVSDSEGFARFPFQIGRDRTRLAIGGSPMDTKVMFSCTVRRLENVLNERELRQLDLLKIDVEGFEQQVLDGLGDWLGRCENIIFEQLQRSGDQVIKTLQAAGFTLMTVEGKSYDAASPLPENNIWAQRAE